MKLCVTKPEIYFTFADIEFHYRQSGGYDLATFHKRSGFYIITHPHKFVIEITPGAIFLYRSWHLLKESDFHDQYQDV